MSDEIDVVLDQSLVVEKLEVDVKHGRNDFVRQATAEIAKELVERGCLLTRTEFDIESGMYRTYSVALVGRRKRVLPE